MAAENHLQKYKHLPNLHFLGSNEFNVGLLWCKLLQLTLKCFESCPEATQVWAATDMPQRRWGRSLGPTLLVVEVGVLTW